MNKHFRGLATSRPYDALRIKYLSILVSFQYITGIFFLQLISKSHLGKPYFYIVGYIIRL